MSNNRDFSIFDSITECIIWVSCMIVWPVCQTTTVSNFGVLSHHSHLLHPIAVPALLETPSCFDQQSQIMPQQNCLGKLPEGRARSAAQTLASELCTAKTPGLLKTLRNAGLAHSCSGLCSVLGSSLKKGATEKFQQQPQRPSISPVRRLWELGLFSLKRERGSHRYI